MKQCERKVQKYQKEIANLHTKIVIINFTCVANFETSTIIGSYYDSN